MSVLPSVRPSLIAFFSFLRILKVEKTGTVSYGVVCMRLMAIGLVGAMGVSSIN